MLPLIGLCTLLPAKALAPSSEADGSELTAGGSRKHSSVRQSAISCMLTHSLRGTCCLDTALTLDLALQDLSAPIMLTARVLSHACSKRCRPASQLHLQSPQNEGVQTHVLVPEAGSQVCWGQVRRPCWSSQRRGSGACGRSGGAAAAPRLRAHHAGRCCLDRCRSLRALLGKQLVKTANALQLGSHFHSACCQRTRLRSCAGQSIVRSLPHVHGLVRRMSAQKCHVQGRSRSDSRLLAARQLSWLAEVPLMARRYTHSCQERHVYISCLRSFTADVVPGMQL